MFRSRKHVKLIVVSSAIVLKNLFSVSSSTAEPDSSLSSSIVASSSTYPANNPIEDRHFVGVYGGFPIGAVLDGHGGWQVSQFASQRLVPTVLSHLTAAKATAGTATAVGAETTATSISPPAACGPLLTLSREEVSKRIIESFLAMDREYVESIRAAYARGFGEVGKVGSCVCLALVRDKDKGGFIRGKTRELVVANAGDCRAVLGTFNPDCVTRISSSENLPVRVDEGDSNINGGSKSKKCNGQLLAIQLTHDHNARERREQDILCKNHPNETLQELVRCKSAHACYVKGRLQLTRALGDLYLKDADFNAPPGLHRSAGRRIEGIYTPPYVSATPEVTFCTIDDRDKFVILASDGVWDYMSPQEAVEIAQSFLQGYLARGLRTTDAGVSDAACEWATLSPLLGLSSKDEFRKRYAAGHGGCAAGGDRYQQQYGALFEEAYAYLDAKKVAEADSTASASAAASSAASTAAGVAVRSSIQDLTANIIVEITLRKAAAEAGMGVAQLKALSVGSSRRRNHDDTTVVVMYL